VLSDTTMAAFDLTVLGNAKFWNIIYYAKTSILSQR